METQIWNVPLFSLPMNNRYFAESANQCHASLPYASVPVSQIPKAEIWAASKTIVPHKKGTLSIIIRCRVREVFEVHELVTNELKLFLNR